jgi:hypothetical protein
MEYYKTRNIPHTMEFPGHKNIENILIHAQLVKFEESGDFYSAAAKTSEDAKKLVESAWEYICTTPENLMLFCKENEHEN